MGIYSRDYIRENQPGGMFGSPSDWALKYLLIANGVVFFLQLMTPLQTVDASSTIGRLFELTPADIFQKFQLWRLVTYGFCHDTQDIGHVLWNMYFLWMLGRHIEPIYGSREFLAFYLASIVAAGLAFIGVEGLQGDLGSPVIGASGGVMAVTALAALHFPRMQILFMMLIPLEIRWLVGIYILWDAYAMLTADPHVDRVAHIAHLGGAAFALAYKYYNWRILPLWDNLRSGLRSRMRPRLRVHRPPQAAPAARAKDLEREVDRILEKISSQGEESLTSVERETLKDASRRYRDRF